MNESERKAIMRANPMVEGFLSTLLEDLQHSESDEACTEDREARDTGTIYDCPDSTFRAAVAECESFVAGLAKDSHGRNGLDLALDYAPNGYTLEAAGSDLYLERAGHGAGFRDRGLGRAGAWLSDGVDSRSSLEAHLGDDGRAYICGKERA
jgi:hypothetical protein